MQYLTQLLFISSCLLLASCWDSTSKPLKTLEVARNGIHGGRLSSNGEYAVLGSIFHGGSLWRLKDGERLYNWNHSENPDNRIIISADIDKTNNLALTADAASIVLWNIDTGESSRFWTSPAEILDSRLNAGGRYAMLGLADHSAVVFDIIRGGIVRTFRHKGRVRSSDLTHSVAMTGSEDHTAVIWSLNNNKPLITIKHNEDVQLVRLSSDGQFALSAAKYDRAEVWHVPQQRKVGVIPLQKEKLKRGLRITAAAFSEDNRYFLLGFANRTVQLRNTQTLALVKEWLLPKRKKWQPDSASIIDVAFAKSNRHFWVMNSDGLIHLIQ